MLQTFYYTLNTYLYVPSNRWHRSWKVKFDTNDIEWNFLFPTAMLYIFHSFFCSFGCWINCFRFHTNTYGQNMRTCIQKYSWLTYNRTTKAFVHWTYSNVSHRRKYKLSFKKFWCSWNSVCDRFKTHNTYVLTTWMFVKDILFCVLL